MSKKAALHNLGCKVNAYETEAMQEMRGTVCIGIIMISREWYQGLEMIRIIGKNLQKCLEHVCI